MASPTREVFLMTYNHPICQETYNAMSPELSPKRATTQVKTRFNEDVRNMGGKQIIRELLQRHKTALKRATSIVAEQNSPPRAHITKVYGDKKDFGHDKKLKKRRKGPLIGNPLLRQLACNHGGWGLGRVALANHGALLCADAFAHR